MIKPILLLSDVFVWLLMATLIYYIRRVLRSPQLRATWSQVFKKRTAMTASVMVSLLMVITVLDSFHFIPAIGKDDTGKPIYATYTASVLDTILQPVADKKERSYSAPLAFKAHNKESLEVPQAAATPSDLPTFVIVRDYPRLKFGGALLHNPQEQWLIDVLMRAAVGIFIALVLISLMLWGTCFLLSRGHCYRSAFAYFHAMRRGQLEYPVGTALITLSFFILCAALAASLSTHYHVFGTNRVGISVLVQSLKSIRTAFVIGTLTTLVILPFALILGVMAGYFRGWVDEVIQYIYTLLASIPDVLMITAMVMLLIVFIDTHPQLFQTALQRSDTRLMVLCVILGITSFTGLCRLMRGETLKLRELEYIQAAQAFGVSHARIIWQHIIPNLAHIALISIVLQFSGLVLGEAVLTYIGVGVDSTGYSFGLMITAARSELSAEPTIWWSLTSAFVFMFVIVLSTNLLADAIRDAFDPRTRLSNKI